MAKPWGRAGAWADDAEREEREEAAAAAAVPDTVSQNFPTLKEASTSKPKKTTMPLNKFIAETPAATSQPFQSRGPGPVDMRLLPTGPKQRSPEELQYSRGFSNYGRTGPAPGNRMRDNDDSRDGSAAGGGRRQFGRFDDNRRGPPPRASDYDMPSRADEVGNWVTMKKSAPILEPNRTGRFGGGSKADEVDSWNVGKKPISSSFGSGFRDNSSFEQDRRGRARPSFSFDANHERPRLNLDPPKGDSLVNEQPIRTNRPNPFGAARPREDVLAEKGLDWKKFEVDLEVKKTTSQPNRPNSSHSSRPSSAHSSSSEPSNAAKPKPKVNPFGDAKPREVLLKERGQDWRKIDAELEHRGVEREETEEEKTLKEEITQLKEQNGEAENSDTLSLIAEKEKMLENLIQEMDDKVRFGQKAVERPGSRPSSRSGSVNEEVVIRTSIRNESKGFDRSGPRGGW